MPTVSPGLINKSGTVFSPTLRQKPKDQQGNIITGKYEFPPTIIQGPKPSAGKPWQL